MPKIKTTKTKKLSNPSKRNMIFISLAVLVLGVVGTYTITQSNAGGKCINKTYSVTTKLKRDDCVGYIQQLVNWFNSFSGGPTLTIDKVYGQQTADAVKKVQTMFGLPATGSVDPATWNIICYQQKGPGIDPTFPLAAAKAAGCKY